MKIAISKLPNFKLFLNIENRFVSDTIIIPIGYDCHPAYMLNKLNLRTKSLPFDWLNMDPINGLNYVIDNIKSNFILFLCDLKVNDRGHMVSAIYPSTEFMHEKDLIENPETKAKLIRRIERFTKIFQKERCKFLYNIPSYCLNTENDVIQFGQAIAEFTKLIKEDDQLLLYIRFDESYNENKTNCDVLYNSLISKEKIIVQRFIREKEIFGIWGDEKKYPQFFKKINKGLKKTFPKIFLSKIF